LKVVAFILSAYLLFLFAVPCCSFDNCSEEKTAQTQGHESGDGSAPADRDCGSCSPFFTCTSCSGFTVATTELNSDLIPLSSNNQYADYIVSLMPDVDYDFWQPPKLG
jgi:hypothetical protein